MAGHRELHSGTPRKKPASGELLDWEKTFNTAINKERAVIERLIAGFKSWRIMHTDYDDRSAPSLQRSQP